MALTDYLHKNLYIRYLTEDDLEESLAVIHEAYREYENLTPKLSALTETLESLQEKFKTFDGVGCFEQKKMIGCLFFGTHKTEVGQYFTRVSVLPSHRKQHIAQSLIFEMEIKAKENGFMRTCVAFHEGSPHLKIFYERCGYGKTSLQLYPHYVVMEKFLVE